MAYANYGGVQPVTRSAKTEGWFTALRNAITRRVTYTRTVDELSALSNRELSDLGLDRSMIASVARQAAYGK